MPTRETPEVREEEILNACEKLYEKMNFRDVTIKLIGNETSFSRPSIYNYFQSKEEIFFKLFEREYLLWCEDLEKIENNDIEAENLPEAIARSLEKRTLMLKLLADNIYGNMYDVEENSRIERRVSFERAYGKSIFLLDSILIKAFPEKLDKERKKMRNVALELLQGLYPYAFVTPKQSEAMTIAGMKYKQRSIFELALEGFEIVFR